MKFKSLIIAVFILLLSACVSTAKDMPNQAEAGKAAQPALPLERMDPQFLYLAAQQALGRGQHALAARFLTTLIQKQPQDVQPRLELADLYLSSGQGKQMKLAKHVLETIPQTSVAGLSGEQLDQYQMLYARALVANGDVELASDLLQKLLIKHPENAQIRLLLVRMHVMKGNTKQAHILLDQGIKLKLELRLVQAKIQLYIQQKQYKKADRLFASMQKKYPEHEDLAIQRSQLAEQLGDTAKAEKLLKQFIKGHKDTAVHAYAMLGALYVRQSKFEEAIATYQLLLPKTAGSADVYMSLGRIYYQLAQYENATAVFEKAVAQLAPQDEKSEVSNAQASAMFYLAASLEASHVWEKARAHYLVLQPRHDLYLDAQLRLVSIDLTRKDYKDAESRLDELLEMFPENIEVYETLSSLRLHYKAYQQWVSESERILNLGFSAPILFSRAVAFEGLKDFDKLDQTLETLLKNDPEHAEALNFYGYSLADRGKRLNDALLMVNKALALKPQDGYYLDSLAWVYYKQSEYQKAIAIQEKAVAAVPSDPVMQEHLGDMFWRAGEQENARKHWQKALELDHEAPSKIKGKIESGLN